MKDFRRRKKIVVIGAGSVGVTASLLLDNLGFDVVVIDRATDILEGAAQVTCVNHGDGFEYYKKDRKKTGYYCIDGSLAKALIYPLNMLRTDVCTSDFPIRFFLSRGTVEESTIASDDFHANVVDMWKHFTFKYHFIKQYRQWSDEEAEACFLRRPENFCRRLVESEFADVRNVVTGYAGSSFGVNMPSYYSILKAALRRSKIKCKFAHVTNRIEKSDDGYHVHAGKSMFVADHVLLCAGHQIPQLTSKIAKQRCSTNFAGTFYLNSMTFVKLPATQDKQLAEYSRRINFTLQQEHGGMFACLVAPTAERDGCAAIYYPSATGSQQKVHAYTNVRRDVIPDGWDALMRRGISNTDSRVKNVLRQITSLYPFLHGYAKLSRTECRPVFNPATNENDWGADRKVRIPAINGGITADEKISAWCAPKWTNAELVAIMSVDYVLQRTTGEELPKDLRAGCGPTNLHVAKITENFCFRDKTFLQTVRREDAIRYAKNSKLPEALVD